MSLLRVLPLAAIAALLFSVFGQVATAVDETSDNVIPDVDAVELPSVELPSDDALTAEPAEKEGLEANTGSDVEADASVDEPVNSETSGEATDEEAVEVADESADNAANGEGLDASGDDVVGDAEAGKSEDMTADMFDEAAPDNLGGDLTDSVGEASSDVVDDALTDESIADPTVDEALTNQTEAIETDGAVDGDSIQSLDGAAE